MSGETRAPEVTMKIGIISDIHGNCVALDAVLRHLARHPVDRLVCLGDIAGNGPQPREAIARVRALGCPVVMGNGEAQLLRPVLANDGGEPMRRFYEIYRWGASQLSDDDRLFIGGLPATIAVPLGGEATLLCCHGSPRSYYEGIRSETPEREVDELLADAAATVVACGHTHRPFVRRHRGLLVINPGTVGTTMVIDADRSRRLAPWGEYAVVTWDAGSLGIECRRVPIDLDAVRTAALASGMPYAQWWLDAFADVPRITSNPLMPEQR